MLDLIFDIRDLMGVMYPGIAQFPREAGNLQFQLAQVRHGVQMILAAIISYSH